LLRSLIDIWISRYASPEPAALGAVAHLRPAVVVTGGSRGIGYALAHRFARAGYDVAVIARSQAPLEEAAATIARECRVRALALPLDVTHADAPSLIDARLADAGFYTDVLVNCAGVGLAGRFVDHSDPEILDLLNLNVGALTRLMHHALGRQVARGRGGVMNIASLGGMVPGPYQAAYYASKAYVLSLTEGVGEEIAGRGVRICAVAPGPVNTGFHAAMGSEFSFYRQLIMPLNTRSTAEWAYAEYVLGIRVIVPGVINKVLALASWILPNFILAPIVGWLLRPAKLRPWAERLDSQDR
jgi:short-subunit dehydrogenase